MNVFFGFGTPSPIDETIEGQSNDERFIGFGTPSPSSDEPGDIGSDMMIAGARQMLANAVNYQVARASLRFIDGRPQNGYTAGNRPTIGNTKSC